MGALAIADAGHDCRGATCGAMDLFRETAFCLSVWHAFLTSLATVLLITLNDLDAPTALLVAANIALIFALVLMARAGRLTERNILRGEFWRTLPHGKRPPDEAGVRLARQTLQKTWLTFAKGAAAVAIVLSSCAYASNSVIPKAWSDALRAPVPAQMSSTENWSSYRSARLLPMN